MEMLTRFAVQTNFLVTGEEDCSLRASCLMPGSAPLRAAGVLASIVVLRHPIGRINSEFWYSGLGCAKGEALTCDRKLRGHKQNTKLIGNHTQLVAAWERWSRSDHEKSLYRSNYYVRSLGAECTNGDAIIKCGFRGPRRSHFGPCCPIAPLGNLTLAKTALAAYDLVLTTESLGETNTLKYIHMHLRKLWNMQSYEPAVPRMNENIHRTTPVPVEVLGKLEKDNAEDLALYFWARELQRSRMATAGGGVALF